MSHSIWSASTALAVALLATPSLAQTLTIGVASEPTAIDPHYHDLAPNNALGQHIFSGLGTMDKDQIVQPGLALSWDAEDDNTWVFHLRDDVSFSNGEPFDAEDVVFTFCRTMNNETAIGSIGTSVVANFDSTEIVDPYTLKIVTSQVEPLLPERLAQIMVLSKSIVDYDEISFDLENGCGVTGPWPSLNDFNTGGAAIGTGPFVLESFDRGASITLTRNDNYFGELPEWEAVRFVPVPSSGPRLAGLLSGDYDLIESPAARDIPQIEADPGLDYVSAPSSRVIFLQMDVRDDSPFIETEDGSNPFQDQRVRQALSMAIDRQAIVDRIMNGFAEPAYQFVPESMYGALPDPEPLPYDPEQAQQLLTEAGYPDGFRLTFHATNDRYINDSQVAQVVAQFLTQVGIETELDAMTGSIFFSRRANEEFSFSMGGWGSSEGGAASFLRQYVTTANPDLGVGASNYGHWSDPEFDDVLLEAIRTVDETERAELLQVAAGMAIDKMGYIPLHFENTLWAFREGLHYPGRLNQYTLAHEVVSTNAE